MKLKRKYFFRTKFIGFIFIVKTQSLRYNLNNTDIEPMPKADMLLRRKPLRGPAEQNPEGKGDHDH